MSKATDKAYDAIRSRILSGHYTPGSHLKEEQIAEDTGVSRTPVREALRRLSAEHLVKFIAHRGAYVSNWTSSDVDDIFRLRAMLEGYAALRAAERISPAQVATLEDCAASIEALSATRTPDNHARMLEHNQRFHSTILAAAESDRLEIMLSWLVEVPMLLRTYEKFDDSEVERSNHHHREIICALRAGDGEWAQKIMETHIRAAHRVYMMRADRAATARAGQAGGAATFSSVLAED